MSLIPIHVVPGSTSVSVWVHICNQSDGGSKLDMRDATGLVTTDLTAKYCRTGGTEQTITLSALGALNSAYSSGGFFEAAEGWYRLDLPDAAVAASARQCFVRLSGNPSSQHVSGHLCVNLDGGVNVQAINSGRTDGNNATLKLKSLDVTQAAGGGHAVTFKGGDASGATPAGDGLHSTGGTASTTGGGLAGLGFNVNGGTGAASGNGPGLGGGFYGGTVTSGFGTSAGLRAEGKGGGEGFQCVGQNIISFGAANSSILMVATVGSGYGVRIISTGHCFELDPAANFHGFNFTVSGTGHPLAPNTIDAQAIATDAITAAKVADGTIDRATFAADTGLQTVRSNTAQSGSTSTTIKLDASASATNNFYTGMAVYLTGGTGAGQVGAIIGYDGTTKVATIAGSWLVTPDNTTTFAVKPAVYGNNTIIFI